MDRLAGLGWIASLLARRLWIWAAAHEPLHHAYGHLQVGICLHFEAIKTDHARLTYPLVMTYFQLLITHVLLILVSSLLRFLTRALHFIGFGAAVPPSQPAAPTGGAYRGSRKPGISAFARWLSNGSGGIAGGGLFEFDWHIAKQVLPLCVVFIMKVLLSNFSFA